MTHNKKYNCFLKDKISKFLQRMIHPINETKKTIASEDLRFMIPIDGKVNIEK